MMQTLLVAIGAGAAAALLHASIASGAGISLILVQLSPLPILIAAIGWNHLTGLLAALVAATSLGLVFGLQYFVAFLLAVGLPAWWLGYLSLLGRPGGANGSGTMEWYPVGRLVFWAAVISATVVAAGMLSLGSDLATFQSELRSNLQRFLALRTKSAPEVFDRPDVKRTLDLVITAVAPAAAIFMTIVNVFNLWLAGRVVSVSGRLRRPWPDLPTMALPSFTPGVLAAAIAGSFLPDLFGMLSGVLAASLFMAYAFIGFAVLHAITRGVGARSAALFVAYLIVFIFVWPILAMSLLGLAESAFNIRARFANPTAGPPTTPT
jgi:Predicted membrane protein (DUF2232)